MASVPLQFNFYDGGGLEPASMSITNLEPVLSLPIGARGRTSGIGEIVQQFFFTRTTPSTLTWAVGPMFSFPAATAPAPRTGSRALGPAAAVLAMPDHFVLGALVTPLWTVAGDVQPMLDELGVQPVVHHGPARGWAITAVPTLAASWQAEEVWTVPVGLGFSEMHSVGTSPSGVGVQYYANVVHPDVSGQGQLRLNVSFLPSADP